MVIYDRQSNSCRLYEVKHSDKIAERKMRYLHDEEKVAVMAHRFGSVAEKYVLYRGKPRRMGDVQYLNVEEYLKALK